MSASEMLYTLLIGPLEVLFEAIYSVAYGITEHPGLAIIGLSLAMNLLLLPMYNQTDAIQLEAMETEKRMKPVSDHIKRTFKGNERFMILQTWYRQNHYKPTDALKGLAPLALEIPFFMAAYHFLSGLELLKNASLGPIQNLMAPDGLIVIGAVTINVLPILMTAVNLASSWIYTKGAPLKSKLQLYAMAALFLVVLYDSPSGLVFYWTLNNVFSLIKNLLLKTKNPMRTVSACSSAAGIFCGIYAAVNAVAFNKRRVIQLVVLALLLNLPLLKSLFDRRRAVRDKKEVVITGKDQLSFYIAAAIEAGFLGLLIPSALIHTSPTEFIVYGSGVNPMMYIRYTALIGVGFFLVWLGAFYAMAKPGAKKKMEAVVWGLCGISVTDYMWFGRNYGILSSRLTYEANFNNSAVQVLVNLCVLAAVIAVIAVIWGKKPDILRMAGVAVVIAMVGMSSFNIVESQKAIREKMDQLEPPPATEESLFTLSRDGKNVVVLMLDRGISAFVPYMMQEKPELQEQFEGFTYYPNTLSFGCHTNVGLPAVFGGYEYTPLEMNRRDKEPLEKKHNEALKVMPVLFQSNGFRTTVCDPTYAGYDWIPDLSIFDDFPQIRTHITMGHYNHPEEADEMDSVDTMKHKFLYYSIFKASPVFLHEYLYDSGSYQNLSSPAKQFSESTVRSYGINDAFRNSYNVLKSLPALTEITSETQDTFMMMCNETTHSPQLLQLPDYEPLLYVDNSQYDKKNPERTDHDGRQLVMTDPKQVQHYHCNMASFLQIGEWLDYLRENDVYDNTRIIIVSDHGYYLHLKEEWEFGDGWDEDIMYYNPLLMVKDFGSLEPFRTDETFMTNADVPTLATQGLIEEARNPFTGHRLDSAERSSDAFYLLASHHWDVSTNNGNTYLPDDWIQVRGDMKDKDNWNYVSEKKLP